MRSLWGSRDSLGGLWELFGGILGVPWSSWKRLGAPWGAFEASLGPLGERLTSLVHSLGLIGRSGGYLEGVFLGSWRLLSAAMGCPWAVLKLLKIHLLLSYFQTLAVPGGILEGV